MSRRDGFRALRAAIDAQRNHRRESSGDPHARSRQILSSSSGATITPHPSSMIRPVPSPAKSAAAVPSATRTTLELEPCTVSTSHSPLSCRAYPPALVEHRHGGEITRDRLLGQRQKGHARHVMENPFLPFRADQRAARDDLHAPGRRERVNSPALDRATRACQKIWSPSVTTVSAPSTQTARRHGRFRF